MITGIFTNNGDWNEHWLPLVAIAIYVSYFVIDFQSSQQDYHDHFNCICFGQFLLNYIYKSLAGFVGYNSVNT